MSRLICALILLSVSAADATGQSGLDAASGKVGILEAAGSIGLDISESKLTLFWVGSTEQKELWRQWDFSVSGAAKKSTRSILANDKWNPEFSASLRHAWFFEDSAAGYKAIYVAAQGIVANADLFNQAGDVVTSLSSKTQSTLFGAVGFNYGITEDHIIGLTVRGGKQRNATASSKTEEVCTRKASGTVDGVVTEVVECKQRLKGDPFDRWVGHLRLDGTFKVITPKDADAPTIGVLIASSLTAADNSKPVFALAGGPTLHPPGLPSTFAAGILAEISDLGNATDQDLDDRFFVRLYAAIPFSIF